MTPIWKAQWAWWTKFNTPAKRKACARHAASTSANARLAALSPERRREIARKAGRAAWYGNFTPIPCPRCLSSSTHHNGTRRGKQRWRCNDCRRSYYGDQAELLNRSKRNRTAEEFREFQRKGQ